MAGPVGTSTYSKGDVIVVLFPFSDQSGAKPRPALVIAAPQDRDLIVCAITSKAADRYAVTLDDIDFEQGNLARKSHVRANVLFMAEPSVIRKLVGNITPSKMSEVTAKIISILNE